MPQDHVEVTLGVGKGPDADVDEERTAPGEQAVGAAHRRDLAEGLQLAGDAQAACRRKHPLDLGLVGRSGGASERLVADEAPRVEVADGLVDGFDLLAGDDCRDRFQPAPGPRPGALVDHNAAPAPGLACGGEGAEGAVHKVVRGFPAIPKGDPHADRAAGGEVALHVADDVGDTRRGQALQDDGELVTADPGEEGEAGGIGVAPLGEAEDGGHVGEQPVPGGVTPVLVEGAEPIEVDDGDGQRGLPALRRLQPVRELGVESPEIGTVGEEIRVRDRVESCPVGAMTAQCLDDDGGDDRGERGHHHVGVADDRQRDQAVGEGQADADAKVPATVAEGQQGEGEGHQGEDVHRPDPEDQLDAQD